MYRFRSGNKLFFFSKYIFSSNIERFTGNRSTFNQNVASALTGVTLLAVPVLLKNNFEHENDQIYCCACQIQGWRDHMEDYIAIKLNMCEHRDWHYFAVFDGHINEHVAKYCADELPKFLEAKICDIIKTVPVDVGKLQQCLEQSYLEFDEVLRKQQLHSGSTCTSILMGPDFYVFANVGDSRSFLISNNNLKFATGRIAAFLVHIICNIYGNKQIISRKVFYHITFASIHKSAFLHYY